MFRSGRFLPGMGFFDRLDIPVDIPNSGRDRLDTIMMPSEAFDIIISLNNKIKRLLYSLPNKLPAKC
jgi:hypothetical protein